MIIIGVIAVIAIIIIWFIVTYNNFVALRNKVKEGYSTIDVFLKKRYDLIPNIVETVKGYAKHEKETLNEVIKARGNALGSSEENRAEKEGELTRALGKLLMLTENYPDLKADKQFLNLQEQLKVIESEIERSRRYYNGVVKEMNVAVEKIPSCLVASLCNFKTEKYFEIINNEERNNVKIQF